MTEIGVFPKTPLARACVKKFGEKTEIGHLGHREDWPTPPLERALRYVSALPSAISGQRGHDSLFRVACVVAHGFALSDEQAWPILLEYNARCLPPWNEHELRHKLSEARKVSHLYPRGYLLGSSKTFTPTAVDDPPQVTGRISPPKELAKTVASKDANDPEARRIADEPARPPKEPSRWHAKVLTGDAQPRTREEHVAFHLAAFERGDVCDLSNPSDADEFDRLYRKPVAKRA